MIDRKNKYENGMDIFSQRKYFCLFVWFISFASFSQSDFSPEVHSEGGDSLPYQILLPDQFSEDEKYPLILFLHGAGERGSDNEKQLVHGSRLFLNEANKTKFPALVIFPQCPADDYWAAVDITKNIIGERQFNFNKENEPTWAMQMVLSMVDSIADLSFIAKEQIYVMGLSMGGMGSFEIVSRRPQLFAAAVPICGGGDPESVPAFAEKTKFWIFHGAKDDVVYPQYSVSMALALHQSGVTPRFTLYTNANHNSWDPAFAEPNLLPWLFSQTKSNNE